MILGQPLFDENRGRGGVDVAGAQPPGAGAAGARVAQGVLRGHRAQALVHGVYRQTGAGPEFVDRSQRLRQYRNLLYGIAGEEIPPPTCETDAVEQNKALAKKLRIRSTPSLVFPDGRAFPGYKPAADIIELLEKDETYEAK